MSVSGENCAMELSSLCNNPALMQRGGGRKYGEHHVLIFDSSYVFVEIIGAGPHKTYKDVKTWGCL
jgi:hypothetical protein